MVIVKRKEAGKMTKEKKKPLLSKSTLIIRLIAGMYLCYLAYELFFGLQAEGGAPLGISIASAVGFLVCGLILVIFSGKDFLKGNYEGGAMDIAGKESEKNLQSDCILEDKIEEK